MFERFYLSSIIILLLGLTVSGQHIKYFNIRKKADFIKENGLNVVLDNDTTSFYSRKLKAAVENNWNFSKYNFVTREQMATAGKGKGYYLGYFVVEEQSYANKTKGLKQKWEILHIFGIVDKKPEFIEVYSLFPAEGIHPDNLEAMLAMYVRLVNSTIKDGGEIRQLRKKRVKEIKNKKLLVLKEHLKIPESEISSYYPYKIEVVDHKTLNEAILNKEDKLFYYYVNTVLYTYHYVFSTKNSETYFFLYSPGAGHLGLTKLMLKQIAKDNTR